MRDAVIAAALRTPVGKRNGALKDWHPVDLSGHLLAGLAERTGIDPSVVDDVIWGCVSQTGEQTANVGRNAVLAAGWPETVPGVTIDRQCGSSQQAVHFAAAGVIAGQYDVAVAGGVESMTRIPMGVTFSQGPGVPFGPKMFARYESMGGLVPQGISAEMIAERWGITRQQADEFSLASHEKAAAAVDEGRFAAQIVPVPVTDDSGERVFDTDEGIRRGGTLEKLGGLNPAFKPDGIVTAANSSQISDGASALLITTSEKARELGLTPLVRVHTFAMGGVDPIDHADRRRSRRPRTRSGAAASISTRSAPSRSTRRSPPWCWPGSRRSASRASWSTPTAARSRWDTRSAAPEAG